MLLVRTILNIELKVIFFMPIYYTKKPYRYNDHLDKFIKTIGLIYLNIYMTTI